MKALLIGGTAWLAVACGGSVADPRPQWSVELATDDYQRLREEAPEVIEARADADIAALARGRGIIDYVASLTDAQATSLDAMLAGRTERLWDAGQGL